MFENLLTKQDKLNILIDSESFDRLLSEKNDVVEKLLDYTNTTIFDFVRSPFYTEHAELASIAEIKQCYDKNGNLTSVIISSGESKPQVYFYYRMQAIEKIAIKIYGKDSLTKTEIDGITLVFIQSCLHKANVNDLLVTANDVIIGNRIWFESHVPGLPVNIATTDEAIEFMDLFAKFRGTYYIASNGTVNRRHWYLLSFKTKVPNFQLPWSSVVYGIPFQLNGGLEILQGFSNRFTDLLRAVDEIGFQYYLGANNDILEAMVYHLNYFIILVTGIFDSLAILSAIRYNLQIKRVNFDEKKRMQKITLQEKVVGKDFLQQLRNQNDKLYDFIDHEQCFIELIYILRDKIVHRESLPQTTFEYHDSEGNWKANFVEIPGKAVENINQFDRRQEDEPLTEWGIYKVDARIYIEPFHFTKASARKLAEFCNKYFELLNFDRFLEMHPDVKEKLEENRASGTYRFHMKELELFKKCHLGF
jgi:hypothetical protein